MDAEAKAEDKKPAAPKKLAAVDAAKAKECEGNFSKDECHTLNLPEHLAQVSAEGKPHRGKTHHKHKHHSKKHASKDKSDKKESEDKAEAANDVKPKGKAEKCAGGAKDLDDSKTGATDLAKGRKNPKPTGPAAKSPCAGAKKDNEATKSGPKVKVPEKKSKASATKEDDDNDEEKKPVSEGDAATIKEAEALEKAQDA